MITNKHFCYVDSRQRLAGTDSNFSYNLALPSDKKFDRVVVLDALIPKSYYLVVSGNNTFTLTENGTSATIAVPAGDYLLTTFQSVIQSLMNSSSPHGYTYSVTYPNIVTSANTGKYTWSVTGNGGVQPSISVGASFFEPFGFNASSTNTFVANSLTSTNVIKLQVEDRLLLTSNICLGSNFNDFGVLQAINSSASPDYSIINYVNYTPEFNSKIFNGQTGSTGLFALTDEAGNPKSTNGVNITFTLLFYQHDDLAEKVKAFLKLMTLPNSQTE